MKFGRFNQQLFYEQLMAKTGEFEHLVVNIVSLIALAADGKKQIIVKKLNL